MNFLEIEKELKNALKKDVGDDVLKFEKKYYENQSNRVN